MSIKSIKKYYYYYYDNNNVTQCLMNRTVLNDFLEDLAIETQRENKTA